MVECISVHGYLGRFRHSWRAITAYSNGNKLGYQLSDRSTEYRAKTLEYEYAVMGRVEVYIDGLMGSRIFISGGNGIPVLKGQGRVG